MTLTKHQCTADIFLKFIYFNWRLITLQYCGGFCHTLTWISHGCTCVPHPEPPSHLPPHPILLGHPSAPALSALSHASNLDWWSVSHMIVYTLIFTAELFSNIWSETWSFNTCNWVWNQDQWDKQMKDFYLSEPLRVCSMQWCLMSDKKVRMRLLAIVIQVNECFSPSW